MTVKTDDPADDLRGYLPLWMDPILAANANSHQIAATTINYPLDSQDLCAGSISLAMQPDRD